MTSIRHWLRYTLLLLVCFCIPAHCEPKPINQIAAVVNNDIITKEQLTIRLDQVVHRLKRGGTQLPPTEILQRQVLQRLIEERVQLQLAKRTGIRISNERLNQTVKRLAIAQDKSIKAFYDSAKQDNMSIAEFRTQIKNQLTLETLYQRDVAAHIRVSPAEIDAYYASEQHKQQAATSYHVKNILIALPDAPTPAQIQTAKQSALNILKKLKQGGNFSTIAIAESHGHDALQGGDLGWRKAAELPTPFVNAVEHLAVNHVAGPIRTPNGFQLIKLVGKKNNKIKQTPEMAKKAIADALFQRKYQTTVQNWISKIVSQSYVKIMI